MTSNRSNQPQIPISALVYILIGWIGVVVLALSPLKAWGDSEVRFTAIQEESSCNTHFTECLHEAAKIGNLRRVQQLREEYPKENIDSADEAKRTALYWAVRKDKPNVTRYLLSEGANPNIEPEFIRIGRRRTSVRKSKTPLHWAVENASLSQLEMLLEKGANPNVDDGRRTPLHRAVQKCMQSHVKILLEEGANPNQESIERNKRTPLHYARRCGLNIFQTLWEFHASAKISDHRGQTPLHYVVKNTTSIPLVEFIVREMGADVSARDRRGRMPLHLAAAYNDDIDVVKYLVDETEKTARRMTSRSGWPIEDLTEFWEDNSWKTPLHYAAAQSESSDVIRYLSDRFLGQLWFDSDRCPGRAACRNYHLRTSPRDNRQTPLLLAASRGNRTAYDILERDRRVDLYVENGDGNTALAIAAEEFIGRKCKPKFIFVSGAAEEGGHDFLYRIARFLNRPGSDFHQVVSAPYINKSGFEAEKLYHNDNPGEFRKAIRRGSGYDPIVIVGYSWGGASAVDWLNGDRQLSQNFPSVGSKEPFRYYLRNRIILVTLDPVSRRRSRFADTFAWRAARWINVYTNYSYSEDNGRWGPDDLKRMGGHWGRINGDLVQNIKSKYGHVKTPEMFREAFPYIEKEMKKICGNRFVLPEFPSDREIESHVCATNPGRCE